MIVLLLTTAYAEEAAEEAASLVFTADEIVDAGNAARESGDYAKALAYYELAAQRGYARARNNLGSMYYQGLGVEQSPEKAREYMQQALDMGVEEAAYYLNTIPGGE